MTPNAELEAAIRANDGKALSRLLVARPDLANAADWTPPPIHCAILWNKPAMVEVLLDHGADIELRDPDQNTTPLRYAVMYCRKDVIPLLIARGAHTGPVDRDGTSALRLAHYAANGRFAEYDDLPPRQQYEEIVEVLERLCGEDRGIR